MKASYKGNGKASSKAWTEKAYQKIFTTVEDELLIACIVLNREFGFGEQRCLKFLNEVNKMVELVSDQYVDKVTKETEKYKNLDKRDLIKQIVAPLVEGIFSDDIYRQFYNRNRKSVTVIDAEVNANRKSKELTLREMAELEQHFNDFRNFITKSDA